MSATRPTVSIVMATHDRPEMLLTRSIPSVIEQTIEDWELLIRGDGAGPDTLAAIEAFDDDRIDYENLPRKLHDTDQEQWAVGGTHAMNAGLEAARGRYIAHLDDDDAYLPEALETLLDGIEGSENDFVYGKAHSETDLGWHVHGEPFDRERLEERNPMVHCSILYDAEALGHHRYDATGDEPSDWRLWKRMAADGATMAHLDEIVAIHYAGRHFRERSRRGKLAVLHHELLGGGLSDWIQLARQDGPNEVMYEAGRRLRTVWRIWASDHDLGTPPPALDGVPP